jgi:hypothetical protein
MGLGVPRGGMAALPSTVLRLTRIAQEWLRSLTGYAAATYNDKLHLLKGIYDCIGHDCGIIRNPFAGCPLKIKTTVHGHASGRLHVECHY